MTIWLTADTHYGHDRVRDFCDRKFETVEHMNEELISRWNAKVKDNDVVEQFSAKATDHPFNIGVLPRRGRRRDDLLDTEAFNPSLNALIINAIAVW